MDKIKQIISQQNVFSHLNEGILIANVAGTTEGFTLAKEILIEISNNKTSLFLSGGRTPKDFYHILSTEKDLEVGTVGLVDERFGNRFHENSNEKMLMDSGLLQSLDKKGVKFNPTLTGSQDIKTTADEYDQTLRSIHATYQQSIGILGIGTDGHTAGVPADPEVWTEYGLVEKNKSEMATFFDDHGKFYGPRITTTFLGLSMLDLLIVMVFGSAKQNAIEKMFANGPEEEIPSRFFKRPDIATKTLLITDQKV